MAYSKYVFNNFNIPSTICNYICSYKKIEIMLILTPYLHYIGIMVLMGSLITEYMFLKRDISADGIKSLVTVDLIYIISLVTVLTTGLLRWFLYGKGYDFYMSIPLFHIKLTLFIIVGVLAIFPTMKISKWKKQFKQGTNLEISKKQIKRLLIFIRLEFLIILIIPLLAVLIARGGFHYNIHHLSPNDVFCCHLVLTKSWKRQ